MTGNEARESRKYRPLKTSKGFPFACLRLASRVGIVVPMPGIACISLLWCAFSSTVPRWNRVRRTAFLMMNSDLLALPDVDLGRRIAHRSFDLGHRDFDCAGRQFRIARFAGIEGFMHAFHAAHTLHAFLPAMSAILCQGGDAEAWTKAMATNRARALAGSITMRSMRRSSFWLSRSGWRTGRRKRRHPGSTAASAEDSHTSATLFCVVPVCCRSRIACSTQWPTWSLRPAVDLGARCQTHRPKSGSRRHAVPASLIIFGRPRTWPSIRFRRFTAAAFVSVLMP